MVRWRRTDLRAPIAQSFGVELHERTVGKLLRKFDFRRLSARPRHPGSDAADQEALKNSPELVTAALPAHAAGKPLEVWFQSLPSGLTRGMRRGSASRAG